MLRPRIYHSPLLGLLLGLALSACSSEGELIAEFAPATASNKPVRVLFMAGRDSHGPGAHEHRAGSELLASELHQRQPDWGIDLTYGGWPQDNTLLENIDGLVIYCDGGKGHLINNHLPAFNQLLDDGVGVVTLHYAVEVPKGSPSAEAMLRATGGYFETHWSVNPHWEPSFNKLPQHPINDNIEPFTMLDEWYFNMRFTPDMAGVTPILSAVPPAHTMERGNGPHSGNDAVRQMVAEQRPQVTAWAYERPGGGRGFGYTGGHFHANWDNDSARELVLNAIVWTAQGHRSPVLGQAHTTTQELPLIE